MKAQPATPVAFAPFKYGHRIAVDASVFPHWTGIVPDGQPHVLDFHEFLVISKGRAKIALNGAATLVDGPAVFFTPPQVIRRVELIDPMDLQLIVCSSEIERHGAWVGALPQTAGGILHADGADPLPALREIARRMQAELVVPRFDTSLMLDALLTQFLVTLNRSTGESTSPVPVLVSEFRSLLERSFRMHHDVMHYADRLGVTPDHLSAVTRECCGASAKVLIRRRILSEAARLLSHSSMSIAGMADVLGFEEPSHFTRFFSTMTGLSPIAYRRQQSDHGFRQANTGN